MSKQVWRFAIVFAVIAILGATMWGRFGRVTDTEARQNKTTIESEISLPSVPTPNANPPSGGTEDHTDQQLGKLLPNVPKEERKTNKPPIQFEPLVDPHPEQTKVVMDVLRSNYEKINTLEYTVQVEFEDPYTNENTTKTIRVNIPDSVKHPAPPDSSKLGLSHAFEGIMDFDMKGRQVQMSGKLSEGVFTFIVKDAQSGALDVQTVPQEEMLGRQEAFDSIFFYNYVTWDPQGLSKEESERQYFLKAHRSKLRVDRESGRPISVLSYDPRGQIELKQDFIDYYEFPALGFTFPKTVEVNAYTNGKTERPKKCVCRITNLKINGHND